MSEQNANEQFGNFNNNEAEDHGGFESQGQGSSGANEQSFGGGGEQDSYNNSQQSEQGNFGGGIEEGFGESGTERRLLAPSPFAIFNRGYVLVGFTRVNVVLAQHNAVASPPIRRG